MLISIVGKSGGGKSYIADILASYTPNALHIDIDDISHQILQKQSVKQRLIDTFGQNIMVGDEINRSKLGHIVFNSTDDMQKLTDITWENMEKSIDQIIENNPNKTIILDWILLPKTKYFKTSNLKILVDAPVKIRMERAMKRDKITLEKFLERERASLDFSNYQFDYVIDNSDIVKTKRRVKKIYDKSIISG